MADELKTRDQKLAAYAADCISEVKSNQAEFKSLVRNFPALVMSNGLGQALAFLKAKGKPAHKELYKFVSAWVSAVYGKKGGDLLTLIIENDSLKYRRATQEAMAIAGWLKRFAEAEF